MIRNTKSHDCWPLTTNGHTIRILTEIGRKENVKELHGFFRSIRCYYLLVGIA